MRRLLLSIALLLVSTAASAQPPSDPATQCWPSSHIDKVVVDLADGTTRHGSLLCFGRDDLTVIERGSVGRFRLEDVRRVRKAADRVWDGALKGAAVGLVLAVFGCPAECVLRASAAYGLLGLAVDAIDTNMDTVYRPAAGSRPALGFRVRF